MAAKPMADHTTGEVASALLSVARVMNQVRVHDGLCKRAGVDLDRGGSALLYKLYVDGDNVRPTDLADRLGVDSPAVTRKVQQLERAGLLERSADITDGRACLVRLTVEGRGAIERLLRARQGWLAELLEGWPEADRKELARLLRLFASTIVGDVEARHGR